MPFDRDPSPPPPDRGAATDELERGLQRLRDAAGDSLRAVILFGSRLVGTSPGLHSATDLFVVVDRTRAFYHGLHAHGLVSRSPLVLAALNHWLPPNVVSVRIPGDRGAGFKCFVIRTDQFSSALSAGARDHFCKGRLAQHVELVFTRDAGVRVEILSLLERARVDTLSWVPALLPPRFDVDDYCLRMLRASYAAEIRPESGDRVHEVFLAEREALRLLFTPALAAHGPSHGIGSEGDQYVRRYTPSVWTRLRIALYFHHSRARATLRWLKYVITYDDWLDYIVRKIHRRTGMKVEMSAAERRMPFLLMWPKFFRVLWALRRGRGGSTEPGESR